MKQATPDGLVHDCRRHGGGPCDPYDGKHHRFWCYDRSGAQSKSKENAYIYYAPEKAHTANHGGFQGGCSHCGIGTAGVIKMLGIDVKDPFEGMTPEERSAELAALQKKADEELAEAIANPGYLDEEHWWLRYRRDGHDVKITRFQLANPNLEGKSFDMMRLDCVGVENGCPLKPHTHADGHKWHEPDSRDKHTQNYTHGVAGLRVGQPKLAFFLENDLNKSVGIEDVPADDILVIAEGPKAAAAIAEVEGHTGAAWYGGSPPTAGIDWSSVRGRKVVIWPDYDPTGDVATPKVAKSCLDAGVKEVHEVQLRLLKLHPEKDKSKDAADFTLKEKKQLLGATTPYRPRGGQYAKLAESGEVKSSWTGSAFDGFDRESLSVRSQAVRVMSLYANKLLVVISDSGEVSSLYTHDETGKWRKGDAVANLHFQTLDIWSESAKKSIEGPALSALLRWKSSHDNWSSHEEVAGNAGAVLEDGSIKKSLLEKGLLVTRESELDNDTRYLGAPNGVIDLDTSEILSLDDAKSKLVTRSIPDDYDPDATSEDVDKLFAHLDDEEREWLLSALGCALRGHPQERIYLLVGKPDSGKTTVIESVFMALGDCTTNGYAARNDEELLKKSKYGNSGPKPSLLPWVSSRFIWSDEKQEGDELNVEVLKTLSSGSYQRFRELYKSPVTKRVTATLFWAVNDAPEMDMSNQGFMKRLRALPYPKVPSVDDTLKYRLLNDKKNRQALVSLLVRYAKDNKRPPKNIPSVESQSGSLKEDVYKEYGAWIKESIEQTGISSDVLHTGEVFLAAQKASRQAGTGSNTAFDEKQATITRAVTAIFNIDKPQMVRKPGLNKGARRGWRGLRFKQQVSDEDRQLQQEGLQ